MANQEDKKPGTNGFTGVLAVLALFFSAVWVEYDPLTTSRPPPEEIPEPSQVWVKARLWQDPFTAVQRQLAEPAKRPREDICLNELPGEVLKNLADENNSKGIKTVALGAMIQEASWESMEELQGRRQRYAVLAGLNRFDYLPEDADKLKCLKWTENGSDKIPLIIPYELFNKTDSDGGKTQVVLFWLNELSFQHKPLEYITRLFGRSESEQLYSGTIKIVGPWASITVRDLVNEVESEQKLCENQKKEPDQEPETTVQPSHFFPRNKFVFLSSSATAADRNLLPTHCRNYQALPEFLQDRDIFFERLTSTDDKLVYSLVEELALRGLDRGQVKDGKDYVALVSEWDTLYAQTLPKTFKSELDVEKQCKENSDQCPVVEFSYLRGLDGLLPGKGEAKSGGDRQNNKEPTKDREAIERSDGDSQVDYLRRLTDRLFNTERFLRKQDKELKAIGVFGNDIYDKLLVLQALRSRFPGKILFTTDLDAAYLLPKQFKSVTHNLVVASPFGLSLNPSLQGRLSPFRDSYQTGMFLATQVALNLDRFGREIEDDARRIEVHNKIATWFPKQGGRVFEIGRTGAVSLNDSADGQSVSCNLLDCQNVHPRSDTWMGKSGHHSDHILQLVKFYACLILLTTLLWLLLFLLWRDARRATRNIWRWVRYHPTMTCSGLVAVFAFIVSMIYLAVFATKQEPFSWVDGVSMWPAELIRITTLLTVILLFWRGWRLSRWNDFVVRKRFFPYIRRRTVFTYARAKQSLLDAIKDYWHEIAKDKPYPQNVLEIWKEQIHPMGFWAPFLRAIIPSVVFIGFGAMIMLLSGPPERPYRGEIFAALDFGMLFLTLCAVQILTFFVVDATSRCNRMANQLKKTPYWSPTTLRTRGLAIGSTDEPYDQAFQGKHCDSIFDPFLDMHLIAERSEVASEMIYYPFIALALFIASRSPLFDNWYMPWQLVTLFVLSFTIPLVCALRLRNTAESLRKIALEKLSACLLAQKGAGNDKLAGQLEEAIKQAKSMDKGAFMPFSQQPLLKALLLPLGSWSGFTILEFLIRTTLS